MPPPGVHPLIEHLIETPADRALVRTRPDELFDRFTIPAEVRETLRSGGRDDLHRLGIHPNFVLARGRGSGLAKLTNEQILTDAGNGGLEVNAWITVAGAVSNATGECLFYEAIPAWASGMAGMQFNV